MADVKDINLRTLKRIDPTIGEVIESSCSSALYTYDAVNERWIKENFEGCLHLFERKNDPLVLSKNKLSKNEEIKQESRFGFIILDKSTTKHYSENIKLGACVKSIDEKGHHLVMFTSITGKICCLWFPTFDDADKILLAMKSCASS